MIKINIKIDFGSFVRRIFLKRELKEGEILVLWRDWDKSVTGWKLSKEEHLVSVSMDLARKKTEKMEIITGIKGESS